MDARCKCIRAGQGGTFDTVSVAQCVERVLAGGRCWGHVGNHDCARLVSCKGISQHLCTARNSTHFHAV